MLAVVSDEAETTILLGSVILGYVDVPDLPVLGEEVLDVVDVGPGGKPINLQTDHFAGIRRRATTRHFIYSQFQSQVKNTAMQFYVSKNSPDFSLNWNSPSIYSNSPPISR